ncbi:MAG: hypothetical protein ACYDCI_11915 [Candidatus Limnocylindrales bacterium]
MNNSPVVRELRVVVTAPDYDAAVNFGYARARRSSARSAGEPITSN